MAGRFNQSRVNVSGLAAVLLLASVALSACGRPEDPPASSAKPAPSSPSVGSEEARAPKFILNKPAPADPGTLPDASVPAKQAADLGAKFDRSTLPSAQKRMTMPGGMVLEDLHVGDGSYVLPAAVIIANMVGTLEDGTIFDDARNAEKPLEYDLLQVIPGVKMGVVGMRVGGVRRLTIPAAMAFGSKGIHDAQNAEVIPPDATVIFDIEVVGVRQKILKDGEVDALRPAERPKEFTPIAKPASSKVVLDPVTPPSPPEPVPAQTPASPK